MTPAPPRTRGNASLSEDWCHWHLRGFGVALDVADLGVNVHDPHYVQSCTVCQCGNAERATPLIMLSGRMEDVAEIARGFLRQCLEKTGLTPYALAKLAGVSSTTITRPLNNPDFKFIPKSSTLAKIGMAAELTPPQLPEPSLTVEPVTQLVPLIGEVRAGAWAIIPDDPVVEEQIPVHLPNYHRARLFAVRVAGRSMDLKYSEGTIVIALPAAEAGLYVGDDVVVMRRKGQFSETTLKEVTQDDDGRVVLYPRSTDASFEPIVLARSENSDEGVEIIGVVVYSIAPRRVARGPLIALG